MRLRRRDCGDLLVFDHVRRALDLGRPRVEGDATIALRDIVGTLARGGDFDGCWRPRDQKLEVRIRDIRHARPTSLDEPIDVIRVDRAYFVVDGHKRVAIGRGEGREFIDAHVQHAPTPYRLEPGVGQEAIENTAREQRFRESSGLRTAAPAARFIVSRPEGYGELRESLDSYAYDLSQRLGRLLPRTEAAALWYECVYRPTVEAARAARLHELIGCGTEADLFLSLHRQSQELWGTECRLAQDQVDELVERALSKHSTDHDVIREVVARARRRRPPRILAQRA
jgi:hypothetical protein